MLLSLLHTHTDTQAHKKSPKKLQFIKNFIYASHLHIVKKNYISLIFFLALKSKQKQNILDRNTAPTSRQEEEKQEEQEE